MVSITYEQLNEVNVACQDRDDAAFVKGANKLLSLMGEQVRFTKTEAKSAQIFIKKAVFTFLEREDYSSAATLLFGFNYFDARAPQIQDQFRIARDHDNIVVFGASAMGKSYGLGIWCVCDYLRDPEYTKIIVASVGEAHLKQNLFSDLINAVDSAIVDIGLDTSLPSTTIKLKGAKTNSAGIFGKTFPQDKTHATGRLRGISPVKRRGKPHPKFGNMGRVRVLTDEASNIPEGVYKDFGSAQSRGDGKGRVKFFVAFNPTIIDHWTTEITKPVGGIEVIDEDKDIEWTSERDWHVYRLDGMKSPNVIARDDIINGMMSWSAMKKKIAGGENSEDYWVYGRGMWMRKGHFSTVIPMDFLTNNRGEFIFPDGSENGASVDVSYGGDKTIFTLFRWGLASGYILANGEKEFFLHEGNKITRHCLQIDQQFQIDIPTTDTIKLANEIIRLAKDMRIKPEWLATDSTAIGKGTYDCLSSYFGDVLGINWQNGSSETKILAEDQDIPKDLYANIGTEMWFATRHWLEHGAIRIGLAVPASPLFTELTTRRYKPRGSRVIVESKQDYKSRSPGGASCDAADSFVMAIQLCRSRGEFLPSISGRKEMNGKEWEGFDDMKISGETIEEFDSIYRSEGDDNDFSSGFPQLTGAWDYGD